MKTQILYSILLFSFTPLTWSVTTRLSVNTQGIEGNSDSLLLSSTALSAEGRYATFSSEASNLVPEDRNDAADIFVYDIWLKQIVRVSVDAQGQEGNSASQTPVLSAHGRYVAFGSLADNLVPNDMNQVADIFIYDLQTHQITRITSKEGQEGNGNSFHPSLSADGNLVAFDSQASNWFPEDKNSSSDIFVYNQLTKEIQRISSQTNSSSPSFSANGRYIAFEAYDTLSHIFIYDLQTQQTSFLTQSADGNSFAPSISPEGQYVAFASEATNLVPNHTTSVFDIFIQNLQTNQLVGLNVDDQAVFPVFSGSGQYLVFPSYATNLVPDDTNGTADIFKYEQETQHLERINADSQHLSHASVSTSGCTLVFESSATNLVEDDTNNSIDIFVHQMVIQQPTFDFSTTILDLPTIQITEGGVYRAQLQLMPNSMSTFILNHAEPLSSSNKSCAFFSLESGLLYLPQVEVNSAGQKILYEVVMKIIDHSDPLQFEIIRVTPQ